jgi:hypothetical protein
LNAITFLICLLSLLLPLNTKVIKAENTENKADIDKATGNFTYATTDTKATTNTTWETIGFTVRREKTYGNPLIDGNYAKLMLKSNQKKEEENPDGTVTVTFYLKKSQVNEALKGTALEGIKDKDILYLNAIIRVKNGRNGPGPYYTLNSIKNAEAWKNPNDFNDRFDIIVEYSPGPPEYPVKISYVLYQSGNYTEDGYAYYKNEKENSKKEVLFKTHDEIKVTGKNIPELRVKNKEKYYLYRVYYRINKGDRKGTVLGNRKLTSNPITDPATYYTDLAYIRDRTFTVQCDEEGESLNIVAIYRRFNAKEATEDSEEIIKEYEEPDPIAVIKADVKGNEVYEVTDGIPGTESLYVNAFSSKYLAGSTFTRKYGKKVYTVNVEKTYIRKWTIPKYNEETKEYEDENYSDTRTLTYTYQIERKYSYWVISKLGVYGIDKAEIENDALPMGHVTLIPTGYTVPSVSYIHSDDEKAHITEPKIKKITMPAQTITASGYEPSIPTEDFRGKAEESVVKIICKNDKLIFNGQIIMSDTEKEEKTDMPLEIPSGLEEIGENVLYQANLVIPATKANGEYESTGTLTFKPVAEINPDPVETVYELEINNVVVHTPTVCDAKIENNYKDNQMINPDKSRASLVLDRPFYVSLPTTGDHLYIKGYGYRDYGKYIESRQVKFPFDVYRGSSAEGTFIPKNTWTSVGDNTQFYLPAWVNEGKYTVQFRSIAINAYANNGIDKTEALANEDLENYVATDTVNVEVSGRIYGFNLYDISDYPIWEDVFRTSGSLSLTGFKYTVGDKNQNGESNEHNSKYTLALVNGVHPKYSNVGALKTGYVTRFSLTTVGNMYGEKDYIRITPTFYHVDSKGENRQEVDIYYTETIKGKRKQLVKMGGILDFENKKALRTGDPYLSIPESELITTAAIEGMSIRDWKAQIRNIFTFTNIMLPKTLRTYIGNTRNLPSGVERSIAARSVQNWYGEYYLPSQVYVVPKGFDMMNYVTFNGGLRFKENFWIKDGYIIVNFNIETIQNEERHLSYINRENAKDGYCNMWKREGYQYQKTDYKGNTFHFQDGDYVLYYTDKSAAQDYISAGTH